MEAIGESLKSLIDRNSRLYPKLAESNSAEAITILKGASEDWTEIFSLAEEVLRVAKLVGIVEFSFKPRESNGVAHDLARCASTRNFSGGSSEIFLDSSTSEEAFFCTADMSFRVKILLI